MKKDRIEYDDHGNFLLDGELEVQWMKLHRDIQSEYRYEKVLAFMKGLALVSVTASVGYVLLSALGMGLT